MKSTHKISPAFTNKAARLASGEVLATEQNTVKDKTHQLTNARLDYIPEGGKLIVGHGYGSARGGWLEIDSRTVSAYNYYSWKNPSNWPLFEGVPHGLEIKDYITVVIDKDASRSEYAFINTSSGTFKLDVDGIAGYDGSPLVTPIGFELSDVTLSFSSEGYDMPIWIYGDSYLSHKESDRWPYYLYEDGYTNALLSGYPGEGATRALIDFKTSLTRATPEFALWLLGMNNCDPWPEELKETEETQSNPEAAKRLKALRAEISDCKWDSEKSLIAKINPDWLAATTEFLTLCNERGITPILATIPQTPKINNLPKNEWVRRSGYRYIDFNAAVGADLDPKWYPGMLYADDVHPEPLGARALYSRVLTDFPEIMRR